jgi:hypothetical protein
MIQRTALIGISFAAVFACVLAACGGGGYSTQRIDTGGGLVITLPGGATTLTIVQPAPGQFSVAEAGYTGAFTATTANPAIAIIGVASVFGATHRSADAHTAAATENSVTFTVVGTGNGSTSITVSDTLGHFAVLPVTVSGFSPGPSPTPIVVPIVTMPDAIALTAVAQQQGIVVSEAGYNGTFTAASDNATVASVSPASGATTFIVTALAAGSANVTFKDANNNTATVTVTVTVSNGTVSLVSGALRPQAE